MNKEKVEQIIEKLEQFRLMVDPDFKYEIDQIIDDTSNLINPKIRIVGNFIGLVEFGTEELRWINGNIISQIKGLPKAIFSKVLLLREEITVKHNINDIIDAIDSIKTSCK